MKEIKLAAAPQEIIQQLGLIRQQVLAQHPYCSDVKCVMGHDTVVLLGSPNKERRGTRYWFGCITCGQIFEGVHYQEPKQGPPALDSGMGVLYDCSDDIEVLQLREGEQDVTRD